MSVQRICVFKAECQFEEICAGVIPHFGEIVEISPELTDEEIRAQMSEMFSDHQISPDGYEEFLCDLCHKPNTSDFPHKECSDREQAWSDAQSETEDWDA